MTLSSASAGLFIMSRNHLIAGIVACACVLLFALFKLTYCDDACQNRNAVRELQEQASRERVKEQAQAQVRAAEMAKQNVSRNCPGKLIVTEETEQWRNFNPNHCAVMWKVLEGRLVLEGLYPWLHWEIWPSGADKDIQPPWDVRSKSGTSKWQYIFCEYYTDQFHQAARQGRFECS